MLFSRPIKSGGTDMAKNKIQFQPGLSLPKFNELYGTEKKCRQALFNLRWPNGFVCPKCGATEYYALKSRQLYQCVTCRHQVSLISNTIFEATKLPLTIWFLAIYLITQSKDGISSLNMKRLLGISYNAALRVKHKLQHVMQTCDNQIPLREYVKLDDAYIGGEQHGGKRGRGSDNKIPFVAALQTNEKGHPRFIKFNTVTSFTKGEIASWAAKHVEPGTKVVSDGLGCFPGVSEAGCDHKVVVTGGGPESCELPDFKWLNTIIGNVKNSIQGTYHSISRKHTPRYLAEFCFRFNRRFKLENLIPSLASAAVHTAPVPQRILKKAEVQW